MNNGYFDIKKDLRIIKKGGFFCDACIVGRHKSEMSQNRRYCYECYDLLRNDGYKALELKINPLTSELVQNHIKEPEAKMSTLNQDTYKVGNFRPRGRPKHYKKRSLPEGEIKRLYKQGLGSKAIVARLKEQGIKTSYKTIQRVLSGERKNSHAV